MEEKLKKYFLNLYAMALADEYFDTEEQAVLYEIAKEKGITKEELDSVIFNEKIAEPYIPLTFFEKIENLTNISKIILADGKIEQKELDLLKFYILKFGFEKDKINIIADKLLNDVKERKDIKDISSSIKNILQEN